MSFKKTYTALLLTLLSTTAVKAQDYIQCEDTCTHVHGIDLSHYQGDVFWETLGENSKMAYVYLKATEGGDHIDRKYERNIELAHKYIETKGGLDTEAFCDSLFKFIAMVEKAYNQRPLLYTFVNFYNNYLQGKIDGYKLMIAQYTDRTPVLADDREYTLWQYTGKGRINGINGYVDKSRFMDRHSLREIRFKH